MNETNWTKLIPELNDWNNGCGIKIENWITINGNPELAIGYISIFWPNFVEYEDCIFLDFVGEKIFIEWFNTTKGELSAIEATINHRHITDLFFDREDNITKNQVLFIGRKLKKMWELKLQNDFPDREFVIQFIEEDCENLVDYQITFFKTAKILNYILKEMSWGEANCR